MDAGGLIGAVGALLAVGGTMLAVGLLGRSGRLAPNELVGIRTKAAQSSDRAWYAVHRAAAGWMIAGAAAAFLGIPAVLLGGRADVQAAILAGAVAAAAALGGIGAVRAGRRAGAEAAPDGG
ncbi:hypothetical protein GCM10027440_22520 [Nocardiopsis coralliicola]